MATDISLVNNVVEITPPSGNPRTFTNPTSDYAFNERDELQLNVSGFHYLIALSDLRLNGSGSAPASTSAALTTLSSIFPTDSGGGIASVTGDLVTGTDDDPVVDVAALTDAGALDGTEEVPLAGGLKTTTQAIADLGGGGLGYLVYTALLTQVDTEAPTATVLENTLGDTIGTLYVSGGQFYVFYNGISSFDAAKTVILMGTVPTSFSGDLVYSAYVDSGSIKIDCQDTAGNFLNNSLSNTPIEIRVFP